MTTIAVRNVEIPAGSARRTLSAEIFHQSRRVWYTMRRWWWKSYWNLAVRGCENVPASGPFLLCANHASHLDAPAILAALPVAQALRVSTAAAADVFTHGSAKKFVGELTTNCLPIERNAEFAGGLRTLAGVLSEDRPLVIFPEGARSPDGRLMEFKLGPAMLAIRSGAPIVPVRLRGLVTALPRGSMLLSPADVRVTFGRPISPRPYMAAIAAKRMDKREAYRALTAQVRAAVETMGE
jgi:1-acyl-sn-glycerol-3-phosphate acyltransferase